MTTTFRHRNQYGSYSLLPAQGRHEQEGKSVFHLVTYQVEDGRSWCLSVTCGEAHPRMLEHIVRRHGLAARARAASSASHRFMGESLAYVRSRPHGRRPDLDADMDPEEIRKALESSLAESDPYRAARIFEHSTPYLVADLGLVRLMEGILPSFEADLGRLGYHAEAAEEMEAGVRARSHFESRLVYVWKEASASPFT